MRTINEAAAYMVQADPRTAVTKTALRRLITSGQIPSVRAAGAGEASVRVGAKYLVDLGVLDDFFGGQSTKTQTVQPGAIRPLAVVPGGRADAV